MGTTQLIDRDAKVALPAKRLPRTKRTKTPSSLDQKRRSSQRSNSVAKETSAVFRLPDQLDGNCTAELLEQFKAALKAKQSLVVDGSGVERAFTPALQVLVVALRTKLGRSGFVARLDNPSETLSNALRDLGLAPYINAGRLQ